MGLLIKMFVILLSLSMFVVKREHKIAIMLIYGICFMSVPGRFLIPPIFFLVSEITHWREYLLVLKQYRLYFISFIFLFGVFLLVIHSPHLRSIGELESFFRFEILLKYLLILFPLATIKREISLRYLIKVIVIAMCVLSFFGLLNLLTSHADFIDWISEGMKLNDIREDAGGKYENNDRFRVQAMHFNPFDYGFICMAIFLIFYYFRKEKLVSKMNFYVVSFCCIFGIVFCGCRTVLVCSIIGFSIYYVLTHKFSSSMKWIIVIVALFLFAYYNIPFVTEIVNAKFLSMINDNSNVEGSSLAMRMLQFTTVLYYIRNNFLFGCGYNFFSIDMGWKDGRSGSVDNDLEGLEGIYMNLLLERGVVGLLVYIIIMVSLIMIFLSYRKIDKTTSAFCLSLIITYLFYAIMTGELQSAYITFLLLGIGMKIYSFNSNKSFVLK